MNNLILSNVTTVDLAYVKDGQLTGYSFTPCFLVSGGLNGAEQVIIDFGTVKRRIKEIIDHKFDGWDHKLVWSPAEVTFSDAFRGVRTIETRHFSVSGPENAFQRVEYPKGQFMPTLLSTMSKQLSETLGLEVMVSETGKDEEFVSSFETMASSGVWMREFEYTHGLARSTSWGCQAIAHGHHSFVTVASDAHRFMAVDLVQDIHDYLDGVYIVSKEHVIGDRHFAYDTSRGHFDIQFLEKRIVVLDNEPTIENIVTHVARTFKDQLRAANVTLLGISEGRWKGAVLKGEEIYGA